MSLFMGSASVLLSAPQRQATVMRTEAGNVLKHRHCGGGKLKEEQRPKAEVPAGTSRPVLLSCCAEGLAREASGDDVRFLGGSLTPPSKIPDVTGDTHVPKPRVTFPCAHRFVVNFHRERRRDTNGAKCHCEAPYPSE